MKRKHEKRVIEKLKGRTHPFQKDVGSLFALVNEGVASRARAREATPFLFFGKNIMFFVIATSIDFNPLFIKGLVEAQGCFNVEIKAISKKNQPTKVMIIPSFFILQGNIAREIIFEIPRFFNQKRFRVRKESQINTTLRYETKNVDDLLNHICPHFEMYTLLWEKNNDFCLFKEVLEFLQKERQPSKESLLLIVELVYQMNLSSANDKSSKKEPIEHWFEIIENNY